MPFVSIQLNSNRPQQIAVFFDSIEATADKPEDIEVLLHIDKGDTTMEQAVEKEKARRKFSLCTLQTDLVKGYATLWMPLNPLFKMTHPDVYFVINLSDEMLFETKGWDTQLRPYVGYYPDHVFRLRASQFRFRNYLDVWECGFAPDSLAFYTRRWLELSGDWNPCLGPDSFQQCVAFYLYTSEKFSRRQINRDIALPFVKFSGEGDGTDLQGTAVWKRACVNIRAWFILMSHAMQQEANYRAMRMKAYIVAQQREAGSVEIVEETVAKEFVIREKGGKVIETFPWGLSRLRIKLRNLRRIPQFTYYNGGGRRGLLRTFFSSIMLVTFAHMPGDTGWKLMAWSYKMMGGKK